MTNTLDGINSRSIVDGPEERISASENITIETLQNEKKEFKKMNRASVSSGTTAGGLIYIQLEYQK